MDKAIEVAAKITKIVEDGLAPLERMVNAPGWTPEFRAIVWGAVEHTAFNRKVKAQRAHSSQHRVEK